MTARKANTMSNNANINNSSSLNHPAVVHNLTKEAGELVSVLSIHCAIEVLGLGNLSALWNIATSIK